MDRVRCVRTLGFRNLAESEAPLGEAITLAWGANGSGKTNLLEALYVGLAGRSPRTSTDREAIAFGEPLARVEVEIESGGSAGDGDVHEFLCALTRDGERRHTVDGGEMTPDRAELRPPLSVFMPDRLVLVKGPPAARRAHLDRFVAALWPARAELRRRYARGLAQRNALIGRIRAGAADAASLDAWDRELAAAGVELAGARSAACEQLAGPFATAAQELGLDQGAELRYRPRSEAAAADELANELRERRQADVARGFTTHGPHLDELALSLDGRPLRRYASQGQQRVALLALLFAEREALVSEGRNPPLMLLDDVMSELDPDRRQLLCTRLVSGGGQALITATEPGHLPAECPRLELGLREGRLMVPVGEQSQRTEAA
jgi:DNA replication and repair protein RecF